MTGLTMHAARHSSVTTMRRLGESDRKIAKWHGHSEAIIRDVYDHVDVIEIVSAGAAPMRPRAIRVRDATPTGIAIPTTRHEGTVQGPLVPRSMMSPASHPIGNAR